MNLEHSQILFGEFQTFMMIADFSPDINVDIHVLFKL